jgi:hypothetical protein
MDSHFEQLRDARASLPDEVRQTAAVLVKLLESASGLPPNTGAAARAACAGVSGRLNETRLTLALVGEVGAGRRTLVNALLGERVLPTNTARRGSTVTIIRRAPVLEFSASSVDGRSVALLSRKMPDREPLFERSMAQIDRELNDAELLAGRLQATQQRAAELESGTLEPAALVPVQAASFKRLRGVVLLLHSLWSWILRLLAPLPWVKRLPGSAMEERETLRSLREQRTAHAGQLREERAAITSLERELAGTRSVELIAAHAHRLRLEREKYGADRRATFLSQVRDFDGTDIAERIVDYPAKHLAQGVTLMDLPCPPIAGSPIVEQVRSRVAREVDALVVVVDIGNGPGKATAALVRELSDIVPVALVVLTKADAPLVLAKGANNDTLSKIDRVRREAFDRVSGAVGPNVRRAPCVAVAAEAVLGARPESSPLAEHSLATIDALSEQLERERPILLAWREAMRLRGGIPELSRAQAREEESCRKRLSMLESKRIPKPDEFRARLLNRVDGAIEKGADDVLDSATRGLRVAIEGLRSEWKERISSCTARGEVEACIALINETAAGRIAAALEQTAEIVARELHDVTTTLEAWAIEEIHTHYRLVRRLGAEALAPVASELTREDLERELLAVQPVQGAMDAFEKQRVGYGLGGVAAGAVLGTLIAPGIGTAVGAVLGVLAGLLKGTESLKLECIAKIDSHLSDTEGHAHAQLQGKRPDLARIIRLVLDEALEDALGRLNDAITRLMTIELRAIETERAKLERLTATRHTLEECDRRLIGLVEMASRDR